MTASTEVAWENSRHLATPPLVSPPNYVWETSAEIPYGWHVTTQIWVLVLLIGRAAWEIWFNQSEALPRFGYWRVIRMEFAPKPSLKGTGPWKVRSGLWAPERYLDIKSSVLHGPVALFSLPGWTGSYIFEYLNAKFQPVRSEITRFLYAGFYCMKNIYENYGMKNYMKEDHRNYRRKFYSWLPITRTLANSNLAPPRTKIDFPWISVIHLI